MSHSVTEKIVICKIARAVAWSEIHFVFFIGFAVTGMTYSFFLKIFIIIKKQPLEIGAVFLYVKK